MDRDDGFRRAQQSVPRNEAEHREESVRQA